MGGNVVRDTTAMNEAFYKSPKKSAGLEAVDKEAGETNVPIFLSSHLLISVTVPPPWPNPTRSQRDKGGEWMGEGQRRIASKVVVCTWYVLPDVCR